MDDSVMGNTYIFFFTLKRAILSNSHINVSLGQLKK